MTLSRVLSLSAIAVVALLPQFVLAQQNYIPLIDIPGLDGANDTQTYINALYLLSISLAGFLAVGRIIFAGVKYMLTDVVTTKGAAKEDIKAALLGLVIVLGAVLVLETINPELSNLALFDAANRIQVDSRDFREVPTGPELRDGDVDLSNLSLPERSEAFKALKERCQSGEATLLGEDRNIARCYTPEE